MTTASPAEPILSVESACAAMSDSDNQLRYYAAWWLGKHQVQSACELLCLALKDERYRTAQGGYPLRRQAARALGALKNPQAVPALIEALECAEDLRLREAAIQALAVIGDSRAATPLLNLLQSTSAQPYEALIEALATLKVWELSPKIAPFLHHSSERVQCAAARYLYLLTGEAQYIERLVNNLSHENMYLRWAAAFDLGAICSVESIRAIIEAKVPNSLKLLNLKRILEAVLDSDMDSVAEKQEKSQELIRAIDSLLIQL